MIDVLSRLNNLPFVALAIRVLAAAHLSAFVASAQAPVGAKPECLDSLPRDVFTALPVLLDTRATDSASVAILPAADILTQSIAEQVRSMVSASAENLPSADSLLTWRQLGGDMAVTVYRDGRFSWAKLRALGQTPEGDEGLELVDRSLRKTLDSGERLFWPESAHGDSLIFTLSFVQPAIRQDRKVEPALVRVAVPVFTLLTPWTRDLVEVRPPKIVYAESSRAGAAEGRVILNFVVDTNGRIDMETVQEHWPSGRPKPRGNLGAYYNAFVAAAKRGLGTARFEPAVVGGCIVRRRAQQVYEFKLDW